MSETPKLVTMTAVFEYDVKAFPTNPFHVDTPFGRPILIARGNLADECDALRAKLEAAGVEP